MTKLCWNDIKWIITWGIIALVLSVVLALVSYTVGYMVGDTDATRQCIEMNQKKKY